jgi:hypothetical protein
VAVTKTKKLNARQQLVVDHLPWVTLRKTPTTCVGWMAPHGKRQCKKPAYWKFVATRKSWVKSGTYCWSHLLSRGLYGDMYEEERTKARFYEVGVYCGSRSEVTDRRCVRLTHDDDFHHTSMWWNPYGTDPDYTKPRVDEVWGVDVPDDLQMIVGERS